MCSCPEGGAIARRQLSYCHGQVSISSDQGDTRQADHPRSKSLPWGKPTASGPVRRGGQSRRLPARRMGDEIHTFTDLGPLVGLQFPELAHAFDEVQNISCGHLEFRQQLFGRVSVRSSMISKQAMPP